MNNRSNRRRSSIRRDQQKEMGGGSRRHKLKQQKNSSRNIGDPDELRQRYLAYRKTVAHRRGEDPEQFQRKQQQEEARQQQQEQEQQQQQQQQKVKVKRQATRATTAFEEGGAHPSDSSHQSAGPVSEKDDAPSSLESGKDLSSMTATQADKSSSGTDHHNTNVTAPSLSNISKKSAAPTTSSSSENRRIRNSSKNIGDPEELRKRYLQARRRHSKNVPTGAVNEDDNEGMLGANDASETSPDGTPRSLSNTGTANVGGRRRPSNSSYASNASKEVKGQHFSSKVPSSDKASAPSSSMISQGAGASVCSKKPTRVVSLADDDTAVTTKNDQKRTTSKDQSLIGQQILDASRNSVLSMLTINTHDGDDDDENDETGYQQHRDNTRTGGDALSLISLDDSGVAPLGSTPAATIAKPVSVQVWEEIPKLIMVNLQEDHPSEVVMALISLYKLISKGRCPDYRQNIMEALLLGAPMTVILVMRKFQYNLQIQTYGCYCLQGFCKAKKGTRMATKSTIAKFGGIEAVLSALKIFPDSRAVQIAGLGVFLRLWTKLDSAPTTVQQGAQRFVYQLGGLDLLVDNMNKSLQHDAGLMQYSCGLAYRLATIKDFQKAIAAKGVVKAVRAAFEQQVDDEEDDQHDGNAMQAIASAFMEQMFPDDSCLSAQA